jgi:YVTN family beta-propeller protein
MRRLTPLLAALMTVVAGSPRRAPAQETRSDPVVERPGPLGAGVTLLPNGWRIAPAGRHLDAGDLPLAMALHPDGRHLVITNNGWSRPSLRVVDLDRFEVTQKLDLDHAWLGLVWHPDGSRLFSSGAADNTIREVAWTSGRLEPARTFRLDPPQKRVSGELVHAGFVGGLALSPDARTLYGSEVYGARAFAVDVESGSVRARAELPAEGYTVAVAPDGEAVYVSVWGASRVLVLAPRTLEPMGEIPVGEHPNAMVLSPDGDHLFVACANTNAVWVVDTRTRRPLEQIRVSLRADDPPGSTPNALALSPDGSTLLVANADNNTVAVVDVRGAGESRFLGFIPSGWYPTGVAFDTGGQSILVLSGKGLAPVANPRGPQPVAAGENSQYIANLLGGALSLVPRPDAPTLQEMTNRVFDLRREATPRAATEPRPPSAIPTREGETSPIRYVFYVIRENRTYDQVLGDLPRGNGDPNLTLFGEDITPNAHALATEFVLFDNFYVDAEVSYDGHSFSMGAYATDAAEKLWPTEYGGRGGLYLGEGGHGTRNPHGNLVAPAEGYLWDFAARAGVSVRSYAEFASWETRWGKVTATVPGLEGRVHPSYPPFDMTIPDNRRVDIWLEEFRRFEAEGGLPRLCIMRLPNDHTFGTRPGASTPRSMVAENDLALGRVVEAISQSRFWPEAAIFVVEDDAQNGPDHVDAHRSVLLVASPWARRGAVDSTLYTTSGVLRTIELVLGLPPMSQYDAAATPLVAAFGERPDTRPFAARPARYPLDEKNGPDAPGAEASSRMNLSEVDLAPEGELNQILWESVRGRGAVMPPPVRAAFVRPLPGEADDGDDVRP